MNKYKMMAMCSLSIVVILILSLLLPLRSNANDKESLEINLHYEKSTVTVDITVNSDIYTGVVCKYIAVDDALAYDDLAYQTKGNGTILNVNKVENDNYTTKIENVTTRYVVVYVSIGNCSLCDYIDCKPSNNSTENNSQNSSTKNEDSENTEKKDENQSKTEDKTKNEDNKQDINTDDFTTIEEVKSNENKQNETKQEENKSQQTETIKQEENKSQQTETTKQQESKTTQTDDTKKSSNNSTVATSNQPINLNKYDKDTIDTTNFQEIESNDKKASTSTVDTKMPQTGENDTIKIAGIVVFSIIGLISFYKYKESCKSGMMN